MARFVQGGKWFVQRADAARRRALSAVHDATAREALAVGWGRKDQLGPDGYHAVLVGELPVAALDFGEVHSARDTRPLVELAEVIPQRRVILEAAQVALERAMVGGVESNQRGEGAPVGLGTIFTREIAVESEMLFHRIERGEDLAGGFLVSLLRAREAGAIDAVVEAG